MKITSKLPNVGNTIFSVMSQLALEHQAINLSQGFPDFDCDPVLIDLVYKAMKNGHNQYAPMPGLISLREEIAKKVNNLYQATYNPESEITITSGGSEAIFSAIACMIHPQDEVLIFEPAYDLYKPTVELYGGVVKSIALKAPDFTIDWEQVRSNLSEKTKLIIINNPNNPTTKTLKPNDLNELNAILEEKESLYLISDEVYEHIVFDQQEFLSVCKYPLLKKRSFITLSFGKLLHTTGWKIGYCLAPEYLMKEFRKVHQFNVFSVNNPTQQALAIYLKNPECYLQLSDFFEEKRNYFLEGLAATKFKIIPPEGSYFALADYSSISDEDDISFTQWLTKAHKVATIPVSAFYTKPDASKLIRFCFAKKKETLDQALTLLGKI